MPPIPRRDYSIPQPSGFQLGADGKRVPFPAIRRIATGVNNVLRRFFPTKDSYPVETSPTPREAQRRPLPPSGQRAPWTNPRWPTLTAVRGNPTVLPGPAVNPKNKPDHGHTTQSDPLEL